MSCANGWQEAGRLFEGIDFEGEAGGLMFIDRLGEFRDSLDLTGLSAQAEAAICPEKRRYSVGYRTMPPLGCYEPSEAFIHRVRNVTRGRLLKKADKPSYVYDYDEAGRIVRIMFLYGEDARAELRGKPSEISYGLHDTQVDLFIDWWTMGAYGIAEGEGAQLEMLILTVRDEGGRPKFICKATQLPTICDMQPEVEIWGPAADGKMDCVQYRLHTNLEYYRKLAERERKCDVVRDRMSYRCDEKGMPLECLEYERETLRSFPIRMPWE